MNDESPRVMIDGLPPRVKIDESSPLVISDDSSLVTVAGTIVGRHGQVLQEPIRGIDILSLHVGLTIINGVVKVVPVMMFRKVVNEV